MGHQIHGRLCQNVEGHGSLLGSDISDTTSETIQQLGWGVLLQRKWSFANTPQPAVTHQVAKFNWFWKNCMWFVCHAWTSLSELMPGSLYFPRMTRGQASKPAVASVATWILSGNSFGAGFFCLVHPISAIFIVTVKVKSLHWNVIMWCMCHWQIFKTETQCSCYRLLIIRMGGLKLHCVRFCITQNGITYAET